MATSKNARRRHRRRRVIQLFLTLVILAAVCIAAALLLFPGQQASSPKPDDTTPPVTDKTDGDTAPTKAYTADGHYIQTADAPWELRLVNPWNPLPEGYDYTQYLVTYDSAGREFDRRATDALREMLTAGRAYDLRPASLYRSYDLQTSLFRRQRDKYTQRGYSPAEAEAAAATVVARPGTSEHHMGLAADILGSGYTSLEETFENTPAFAWLKEHCAEYGFILRYPKEKQDVTGVIYEPWHYRYVGREVAREIMSRGITLEEYLEENGQ